MNAHQTHQPWQTCAACGREFQQDERARFCSIACQRKAGVADDACDCDACRQPIKDGEGVRFLGGNLHVECRAKLIDGAEAEYESAEHEDADAIALRQEATNDDRRAGL